jgi:hypothetical protein
MKKLIRLFGVLSACLLFSYGARTQNLFLTNGLVAYYPLNGNANDASGNGNDGTVSNVTLTANQNGTPNSSYYFNGVSSSITVPDSPSLEISGDITVTCWANFSTNFYRVRLVGKGGDCGRNYGLWLDVTTNWLFQQFGPAGGCDPGGCQENTESAIPVMVLGNWYQIVGVRSGSNSLLYVNGILVQEQSNHCATNTYTGPEPLLIGAPPYTDPQFNVMEGSIDDIRVYNRALSSNEVTQLYAYEASAENVPLAVAINATMTIESTNSDNGTVTTFEPAKKLSITSKSLLQIIAKDEFNEGNYDSPVFPSGSILVLVNDQENISNSYFVVANSMATNGLFGTVLVNISDLMVFSYQNLVLTSGKEADATGLLTSFKESYIGTFSFDDTGAGGDLTFALQGLTEVTVNDTALYGQRFYLENVNANLSSGTGPATLNGANAVITGTASGNGKAVFRLP